LYACSFVFPVKLEYRENLKALQDTKTSRTGATDQAPDKYDLSA